MNTIRVGVKQYEEGGKSRNNIKKKISKVVNDKGKKKHKKVIEATGAK